MKKPTPELDNMQRKAFRFALRLKPGQEKSLNRWASHQRWVWNQALARQRKNHENGEKYSSYETMSAWLTAWKADEQTAWLNDGPSQPLQQTIKALDKAYKRFFEACKVGGQKIGAPRFKKRGDDPGLRFPSGDQIQIDLTRFDAAVAAGPRTNSHGQIRSVKNVAAMGRIKLPKIGWTALTLTKPIVGKIKNATVSKEGKRWFVSIQVETGEVAPAAGLVPKLGIDMGLKAFIASSDGELVQPLKAMERQAKRLRHYQKSVSRKKKGSCNRRKAIERLGRLHRRIAHQRSDWVHKLTTELANRHAVIAIEDLRIRSMSASARGTAEVPGKNVSAKSGLNRRILDAAWGLFRDQLSYKLAARGGELIKVEPAYTSQECSSCHHIDKGNRLDQETFLCLACGHAENADLNAAKNILAAGLAVVLERTKTLTSKACGEVVRRARPARAKRAASAKQEPTEERKC